MPSSLSLTLFACERACVTASQDGCCGSDVDAKAPAWVASRGLTVLADPGAKALFAYLEM